MYFIYYLAAWYQVKCGAFVDDPKQSFSTFDKYCYESNPDAESFCFGNIYGATECSDIMGITFMKVSDYYLMLMIVPWYSTS